MLNPLLWALCWSWAFRDGEDSFCQVPPWGGRCCYHPILQVRKLGLREVVTSPRSHNLSEAAAVHGGGMFRASRPSHSPQVQLVPHSMVAVSEGPHLALLTQQVLAELMEIVL